MNGAGMAAEEKWTVLVEWEDSPVLDATEIVVWGGCKSQAVCNACKEWTDEARGVYPTARIVNAFALKRGDRWLVDPGVFL
jgi:hypothetical protein